LKDYAIGSPRARHLVAMRQDHVARTCASHGTVIVAHLPRGQATFYNVRVAAQRPVAHWQNARITKERGR
jgi:hypothetical protein